MHAQVANHPRCDHANGSSLGSSSVIVALQQSNTLTIDFFIEAAREAVAVHGQPEIFNTDRDSQFTDGDLVLLIRDELGVALSMDGKGCWWDNVFVERFWRTLKYEEVYLRAYASGSEARILDRPLHHVL